MPKMDGFKVAKVMRATETSWFEALAKKGRLGEAKAKKPCPIVAVTAHQDYDDSKYEEAGINEICFKPLGIVEAQNLIKKYFFTR